MPDPSAAASPHDLAKFKKPLRPAVSPSPPAQPSHRSARSHRAAPRSSPPSERERTLFLTALGFTAAQIADTGEIRDSEKAQQFRRLCVAEAPVRTLASAIISAVEAGELALEPDRESHPEIIDRATKVQLAVNRLADDPLSETETATLIDLARHYHTYATMPTSRHYRGPLVDLQWRLGITSPLAIIYAAALTGDITIALVKSAPSSPQLDFTDAGYHPMGRTDQPVRSKAHE